MKLVLRDGLVEQDAIVVQHLGDAVRQPFRIDRDFPGARLGLAGDLLAALAGNLGALLRARIEPPLVLRRDQLADFGFQRLDHRHGVRGQSEIGGEFHGRDAAFAGLDVGDRHPGAVRRRIGICEPRNVDVER